MTYAKQTWADSPSGGTPINAQRLNHIEDGIAAAPDEALARMSEEASDPDSDFSTALSAAYAPRAATLAGAHSPGVMITQNGAADAQRFGIYMVDDAANAGRLLKIDHYGAAGSAPFGLDIQNYPGAKAAFVIHQYSGDQPAMLLDNTHDEPALLLRNTQNDLINPGNCGTGHYLQFEGYLTAGAENSGAANVAVLGSLDKSLIFRSHSSSKPFWFTAVGHSGSALKATHGAGGMALEVIQSSTSAAQAGSFTSSSPASTVQITATTATAFPALGVQSASIAAFISTSAASPAYAAMIRKTGTGTGAVLWVQNNGTGMTLSVQNSTVEVFGVTAGGLPKWTLAANAQTTVGATGAASALPAAPAKYLKVQDSSGTTYLIPAYNA